MYENTSGQFPPGYPPGQYPPNQLDNTSGQGARAVVPPEIMRWNWGAFFLNWIWGLGNGTYLALLCFVPMVNLVMPFVLGAKGSEWAWRNQRWSDIAHFRRVQRNWAIAGIVVFVGAIATFALIFTLFFVLFGHSEAYLTAANEVKANPAAIRSLGEPITTGFPSGNINLNNNTGSAKLSFSASGPKADGTVFVVETLRGGHWVITRLELELADRRDRINLIGQSTAIDEPIHPRLVRAIATQAH